MFLMGHIQSFTKCNHGHLRCYSFVINLLKIYYVNFKFYFPENWSLWFIYIYIYYLIQQMPSPIVNNHLSHKMSIPLWGHRQFGCMKRNTNTVHSVKTCMCKVKIQYCHHSKAFYPCIVGWCLYHGGLLNSILIDNIAF